MRLFALLSTFLLIVVVRLQAKSGNDAPDRLTTALAACERDLDSIIAHGTLQRLAERVREAAEDRSRKVAYPKREEIIGCMLLCVFRKLDAVDSGDDLPTVEGLTRFFGEGATTRGYFLAVTQAVQQCVAVGRSTRAETATRKCATTYAIFDCVRGQLADFRQKNILAQRPATSSPDA